LWSFAFERSFEGSLFGACFFEGMSICYNGGENV
jgi:hypothetical protein